MPNEPEKPIEKLLRACGRKRREEARRGGHFELHPATRRLLQGEVTRRFRRPEQGRAREPRRWAGAFWPRLVEACVLVTLMAVVASLLIPALRHRTPETRLAKNDADKLQMAPAPVSPATAAAPPAASAPEGTPPPVGREHTAPSETLFASKERRAMREPSNGSDLAQAPSPALAGQAAPGGQGGPATLLAQRNRQIQPATPDAPPAPAVPPTVGDMAGVTGPTLKKLEAGRPSTTLSNEAQLSLAEKRPGTAPADASAMSLDTLGELTNGAANAFATGGGPASTLLAQKDAEARGKVEQAILLQHFQQVPSEAKAKAAFKSKSGLPILASFEVEQTGEALRVIDSDGSVYTGTVETAEAPKQAPGAGNTRAFAAAQSAASGRESLLDTAQAPSAPQAMRFFRVMGTNRSLNQPVVFSGNLSAATNGVLSGRLQGYLFSGATAGQVVTNALPSAQISGQAVIGSNRVMRVHAVPAP